MTLLSMSVGGSIFIILLCLGRILFSRRLSGRTRLALWSMALFRLLCPIFLPLYMSFYSLFTVTGNNYTPEEILDSISVSITELPLFSFVIDPYPSNGWNWDMLRFIWLAGAVLCAFFHLLIYLRSCKHLSESLPADTPYIQGWMESHPLRRPYQIRVYDRITSPVAYGVFRPVILLDKAAAGADEEKLNLILTHEFLHIRRHHILLKWTMFLVCVLHWFNPLVWLMAYYVQRDIEADCDEAVVQTLGEEKRLDYAQMLLEIQPPEQSRLLFTVHFAGLLEQRIRGLLDEKHRKKSGKLGIAAAACLLVIGTAQPQFVSAGASDNPFTVGINETVILDNDGNGWDCPAGEPVTITFRHQNIWPLDPFGVGQGMCIGYILNGEEHYLYKGQNQNGIQIVYTPDQPGTYSFFITCHSSDPLYSCSFIVQQKGSSSK